MAAKAEERIPEKMMERGGRNGARHPSGGCVIRPPTFTMAAPDRWNRQSPSTAAKRSSLRTDSTGSSLKNERRC